MALILKYGLNKMKTGLFLIILGIFIWLLNLGVFSFWKWGRDWPWILIITGIFSIFGYLRKKFKKRKKIEKEEIKEILHEIEKGKINVEEAIKIIKNKK